MESEEEVTTEEQDDDKTGGWASVTHDVSCAFRHWIAHIMMTIVHCLDHTHHDDNCSLFDFAIVICR